MVLKSLASLICVSALTVSPIAAAQSNGYGQEPYAQQQHAQPQAVPQEAQFLMGEWSVSTPEGRTVSEFFPDGSFRMMHFAKGVRKGQYAQGRFQVKAIGNGRLELLILAEGQRQPIKNILEMRNGQLFNLTAGAVAVRSGASPQMRR